MRSFTEKQSVIYILICGNIKYLIVAKYIILCHSFEIPDYFQVFITKVKHPDDDADGRFPIL